MKNEYSIYSKFKLFIWLIRTKIIAYQARIIRFPLDIRGRKYIDMGRRLTTGVGCRLEAFSEDGKKKMFFGSDVQINDYVHINAMCKVEIGNNVLIASHVYISDNSHGIYKGSPKDSRPDVPPIKRDYYIKPVSNWMCAKAGIITFVSAVLIKGASNNERRGTIPICFFVMVKLSRKRSSSDNVIKLRTRR